jgi:hypothetical protein
MKKLFIHCDCGFVHIRGMNRVCWWWLRRAGISAWGGQCVVEEKCIAREMEKGLLRFE